MTTATRTTWRPPRDRKSRRAARRSARQIAGDLDRMEGRASNAHATAILRDEIVWYGRRFRWCHAQRQYINELVARAEQ